MKNDIKDKILKMTDEELKKFIRDRLEFNVYDLYSLRNVDINIETQHKRFDMSGYENKMGSVTVYNINLLNLFADCGIYENMKYLFLDFYKGCGTLYYSYWNSNESLEKDLCGVGTIEIIIEILKLTVIQLKGCERRRE